MRAALFLMCLCMLAIAAEPEKKVLFGCHSGDAKVVGRTLDYMLHLANYYDKHGNSHDIVMVAQSECVKFMLDSFDGTEYKNEDIPVDIDLKFEKLKGKVRFEQCAATLDRKQIEYKKLKKNVKVVPSATVATVDYQLKGYAYMPENK